MALFITGGTGFIGRRMAMLLAEQGETLHLLVRNPDKARDLKHERIHLFKGDIMDRESMVVGMKGCDRVIHMASFVDVWSPDPATPYLMNVQGTVNVMEAALQAGIRRVVCTSTAGTLGPSAGTPVNEDHVRTVPFFVEYESTKFMAEERALRYVHQGLEVVIVNPTRVFGPGELSKNNGWVKLMHMYLYKRRSVMPGRGDRSGNFVFVDDVIKGTLLALQNGKNGSRYILGGDNATLQEFFQIVKEESGVNGRLWRIPLWVVFGVARFHDWKARWFKSPPLLTLGFARRYLADWANSVEKARREIGYAPLSLRQGIQQTLQWMEKEHGKWQK